MASRTLAHRASVLLASVCILLPGAAAARQQPATAEAAGPPSARRVLTLSDYAGWKRIQSADLSPDGKWMSYAYNPNDGTDTLYIRELDGTNVHSIANGSAPSFSGDSRWVTYTIAPAGGRGGRGGGRGQTPPAQPQRGGSAQGAAQQRRTELLDLRTGKKFAVPDIRTATFSPDARFLAMHRNKAARDSTHDGADLLLRNLAKGDVQNIGNVSEFAFDEKGGMLAWTVDAPDGAGNGAFLLDLKTNVLKTLDASPDDYAQLTWNENGTGIAVLRGKKPDGQMQRANALVVFTGVGAKPAVVEYDPAADASFPKGFVVSELGALRWSDDGTRLFLGIKEQESELPKTEEAQADLEVWHWKDEDVQSVQKVRADQARRFTYAASFDIPSKKLVRLANDDMRTVQYTQNERWAIGRLDKPYRLEVAWGGAPADFYRVDPKTGERELMVPRLSRSMGTSPDGKWFLFVKDDKLQVRELATGRTIDLDALAGTSFVDTMDDHDYERPAYGLAGWTKDGRGVIVNHRFDLWLLPLDGGKAVNLTAGVGEKEQIQFRVQNLAGGGGRGGRGGGAGGDERTIDTSKPILLSAYGEWTKKSGWYEVKAGSAPRPLVWMDKSLGSFTKADSADRVIFTEQTFEEFPDYWTSTTAFASPRKVTDANPQLAEYAWGHRVLVDYTDARGNKLQATLALPANYEQGKRYPMLVYFYEKMSQNHHQFSMPVYDDRPHMSTYASDGYLVLMPDVVYTIGKPGTSAVDDVTSAVKKVIELGYADPAHIGLQGHSWGGYQSSFILTQTDLFAAVVTGAPPTNLVSFYDELYQSTGTVQQGITEVGQVRMGENVTPWNAHELYESQSPIHQAENITTPFMILQGTADGAVDWHQGLEYYNAAKRLGKEVIFLSYNGEAHHLGRKENQIDFQIRMKQFFDHYLKGTPAPHWMSEGVPYIERERERLENRATVLEVSKGNR